jgi:hypothetical protein
VGESRAQPHLLISSKLVKCSYVYQLGEFAIEIGPLTWLRIGIEVAAGLIMIGGIAGILWERKATGRGIGVRVIQLATVLLVMPIILILALEGVLENQTTAALIGTIVGYVLSGIGKDEPSKKT